MNDRVVPFFDKHGIPLSGILTEHGKEYCGNQEHHEYELYVTIEDIDHTRTKIISPQTRGFASAFSAPYSSGSMRGVPKKLSEHRGAAG